MSPTDIDTDPCCNFCSTGKKYRKVLLAAPDGRAFICDRCIGTAAQTVIEHGYKDLAEGANVNG